MDSTNTTTVKVRLESAPMLYTPGVVLWAISAYKASSAWERKRMVRLFTEGFGGGLVPASVYDRLLKGEIPYTVEGDVVVFSYEK